MITQQLPTREILWNVNTTANVVIMYSLFALALVICGVGIYRHVELWLSGKPDTNRERRWLPKFSDLFTWGLLQRGVIKERTPAIAHTLIYLGCFVLLFTTTMVFLDHDLGFRIYQGDFYLGVTLLSDVLGMGVLFGCLICAHRRYVERLDKLHNRRVDASMLLMLSLLIIQGFLLEGLRIHATGDPWAHYSPVGLLVAKFFWSLRPEAASFLHYLIWWFHTITVFSIFAIFPYTKFFHLIASPANLYFRRLSYSPKLRGRLNSPGDVMQMMESGEEFTLGLGSIKDYSWKQLLDLDACTSCGRCQAACPAYLSGKPLSPKWVILDTRNHALTLHAKDKFTSSLLPKPVRELDSKLTLDYFLKGSGLEKASEGDGYLSRGAFRGENEEVQKSARMLGRNAEDMIAGDVVDPNVFWSCTTCLACVAACPVGINHVDQIIGNRRHMALMRGEVPSEAQAALRRIENQGNPYGPAEDRTKWLKDLDVPILKAGDSVDYLYWVGCVSAYDPRKQKIARSLVTLMKKAGLSFGVLGSAEGCTGDPARRLGEENLFQTMAKNNLEILRSIKFKTLVANCPHCFNSIKNEYPDFGNLGEGNSPEIIHHSALLRKLLEEKKLTLKESDTTYTFHDPCYLGRYNNEYEAPRQTLKAVSGLKILEMDRSRENGMCCGAGGGHFWMDMKVGERINSIRADQAAATGATQIATACPFCMQMMEDGAKLTNREHFKVKDIAEVLVENLAS